MTVIHGVDRDSAGAINHTATGTITYQGAIPLTNGGDLRTTTNAGAAPGGSFVVGGTRYASDGSILVTADAIGTVDSGVAFTLDRIICITTNAPDNNSRQAIVRGIGVVLVDSTGRMHVA